MQVQNIPSNIRLYSKRAFNWRLNSIPYLTGDLFADNADIAFFAPRFRHQRITSREISMARVIFCPSHKLEEMLETYGNKICASVLILGNSDRDFENLEFKYPISIKHIFAQNLLTPSARGTILPIGLENRRLATNGQLKLFSSNSFMTEKKNQILVGPFSNTHIERQIFFEEVFDECDEIISAFERQSPEIYAYISSKFRYIVAPRGNGVDTHRFWEALYRGSLPIVMRSQWSEQIRALGVPHLNVDNWSKSELKAILKRSSESFLNPNSITSLWWPYWRSRINSFL